MSAPTNQPGAAFWWRLPDDETALMSLGLAELKCYLVVARAIQRDRNGGKLSLRQIVQRTGLSSLGNVHAVMADLVKRRMLTCEVIPGRVAVYGLPNAWRNCSTPKEQLGTDASPTQGLHCSTGAEQFIVSTPSESEQHCSTGEERNCSTGAEQHLEYSEYSELASSSTQQNGRSEQFAEGSPATTTSDCVNGKSQTELAPRSDSDREQLREALREHFGTFDPPDLDLTREVLAYMQGLDDVDTWLLDLTERRVKIKGWGFYLHDAKNWQSRRADVLAREEARRAAIEAETRAKAQADAAAIEENEAALAELQRQQEADRLEVKADPKPEPKHRRCDRCDNGLVAAPEDARLVAFCGCDVGKERSLREPDLVAKDNENRRWLLRSLEKPPDSHPARAQRSIRERYAHRARKMSQ